MNYRHCRDCGFWVSSQSVCRFFNASVDPEVDGCNRHNPNPPVCEICGRPLLQTLIDIDDNGNTRILCMSCSRELSTCQGCINGQSCDFETNPSELPKVIMKTIQNGNMVMQTQVMNPERIEITCKNGCPCFDPENDCLRQFGVCGNHKLK